LRLRRPTLHAALLAATSALGACDSVPEDAIESCVSDVRLAPARTDVLVVVDDSFSMKAEQENLRQNLAAFVAALAESAIPHDFQIGVTTTSVEEYVPADTMYPWWLPPYDGLRIPFPAGSLIAVDPRALTDDALRGLLRWDPDEERFVGARVLAVGSPTLVADFEANVLVGTQGAGKEEPLRATELALTARIADGTNAGFLRPGARLGVILITDEDDCSEVPSEEQLGDSNDACHDPATKADLASVADFAAFLDGPIDGERREPVLAVIAGFDTATLAPTGCASSLDVPTRLAALLDLLGPERSFRGSICDPSFGPSLQRIADLLVPQTVPLEGAPPDARMLVASIRRAGARIGCPVAPAGAPDAAGAGAAYAPPQGGRPATLTFQGECRLQPGDEVRVAVVCAG
jgi:hypothetical protein